MVYFYDQKTLGRVFFVVVGTLYIINDSHERINIIELSSTYSHIFEKLKINAEKYFMKTKQTLKTRVSMESDCELSVFEVKFNLRSRFEILSNLTD